MKTIIQRANARRLKFKKENPLTQDEIMNLNLVAYETSLTVAFCKQIVKEDALNNKVEL